jgi:hypothetical protein
MANVIELVTKMLPMLDEQYAAQSVTSFLDTSGEFVQMTSNAKRIKVAKMRVDGLADYSRSNGFVKGSTDLVWEEREFTQDRGRALQVDVMDNEESFGLAFGRLAGEFQRTQVIPEIDAYRLSTYYKNAGHKSTVAITSTAGVLDYLDEVIATMNDLEIPDDGGRVAFVSSQVYNAIKNDPTLERYLSWDSVGNLNKRVASYNGIRFVEVPQRRFYTDIELLTATADSTVGGYKPTADAKSIGILVLHPSSIIQISKRRISRIWAPTKDLADGTDGVNPDADAWKFDYRTYHDVWVLDNQQQTIFTAEVTGVGINSITAIELSAVNGAGDAIELSGSAPSYTATVNATISESAVLTPKVTGNGPKVFKWDSTNNNVAMVQNGFVHFFQAGTVTIICESIYNPSVKAQVTFTVSGHTREAIGDSKTVLADADKVDENIKKA